MLKSLTIADKLLLAILIGGTLTSYVLVDLIALPGATVLVEVDRHVVYKAALNEDASFRVHGATGELVVEIRDGRVAVTGADCPNRICVRTGWRNKAGDVIVCVPNKVIVRIAGPEGDEVRAVTG